MKKHLLSFLSIIFVSAVFAQSVPNGGFESWTLNSFENPLGFQTSNYNFDNGVQTGVNATKTTDAYHGNYALKLTTTTTGTNVTFAFFANGDPGKSPLQGGIPYSQKPTGIQFHYKSNIIPTDTAIFLACFKKAGVTIGT